MTVYVFYQVDKLVFAPLTGYIKDDLDLTDSQIGLITGPAATWATLIGGVPLARATDVWNRVRILAAGLVFWSAFTILSAFANDFWSLFLFHIGVGFGEAACNPPAYSLIADYFGHQKRAGAMSVYSLAIYIGGALSYVLGGQLGERYGWRKTLLAVGIPGIVFALVVLAAVREPMRGAREDDGKPAEGAAPGLVSSSSDVAPTAGGNASGGDVPAAVVGQRKYSVRETLVYMFHMRAGIILAIAAGVRIFAGNALGYWIVTFFDRVHGVDSATTGDVLVVIISVGGISGVALGGWTTTRWQRRNFRAQALVPAISCLLGAPLIACVLAAKDAKLAFVLLFVEYVVAESWIGAVTSLLQRMVPAGMRGMASAAYITITSLIGALGTVAVGQLNDAHMDDPTWIRWSMMICITSGYIISGIGFIACAAMLKPDPVAATMDSPASQGEHQLISAGLPASFSSYTDAPGPSRRDSTTI